MYFTQTLLANVNTTYYRALYHACGGQKVATTSLTHA